MDILFGLFVIVGILGLALILICKIAPFAIINLPNDPPEKALMTWLGKPIINEVNDRGEIIGEPLLLEGPGLMFLIPFWNGYWPFLHGYISIPMTEKSGSGTVVARTPDYVEVQFPFTFEIRARNEANSAVELIRSGGIEEAIKQTEAMLNQRIREWIRSKDEGPGLWEEAETAKFDVYVLVLERFAMETGELWPGPDGSPVVPNYLLVKYFRRPRSLPTATEKKKCGTKWEIFEAAFGALSDEERTRIENEAHRIENRIKELMQGRGKLEIPGVGMDLVRFNVGNVKETGKMAEIAARVAEEKKQQAALVVRTRGVTARAKTIKHERPGISDERALEEAKVIDGIVTKTVTEKQIGITAGTVDAIAKGVGEVLGKISGRRDDGKTDQ